MDQTLKPRALSFGSHIALVSPASSARATAIHRGLRELRQLGFQPDWRRKAERPEGYFAGSDQGRSEELLAALRSPQSRGVFCIRGGYGSAYLVESIRELRGVRPKILMGYSDITCLQVALWQRFHWVTFYGPMVAAGFAGGARRSKGYDPASLGKALSSHRDGWDIPLRGRALARGSASGTLLGGCLTLIQDSIGTEWELDTRDSILLLEDCAIQPYQLDRMLVHLLQAGKFDRVRGVVFGEFPNSGGGKGSRVTVREVCQRLIGSLGIPVVYGAPVGHARRAMLTIPLGVRARLVARGPGRLEILEPAVTA
ncbi:MAG: S66 peptidase family protein [Candidatus Acidiferrales bacterium]